MKAWKDTLKHDESASVVFVQKAGTGTKRKAVRLFSFFLSPIHVYPSWPSDFICTMLVYNVLRRSFRMYPSEMRRFEANTMVARCPRWEWSLSLGTREANREILTHYTLPEQLRVDQLKVCICLSIILSFSPSSSAISLREPCAALVPNFPILSDNMTLANPRYHIMKIYTYMIRFMSTGIPERQRSWNLRQESRPDRTRDGLARQTQSIIQILRKSHSYAYALGNNLVFNLCYVFCYIHVN